MESSLVDRLNISARILYDEAIQRGISCTLYGDNGLIHMEKDGKSWYTRASRTSFHSSVGKYIADKKHITKRILAEYGLPTAKFVMVRAEKDLARLEQLSFPLVMKPTSLAHGEGVVVGIKNLEEARKYLASAKGVQIFEEMLGGVEFRIVCVDYKLVAASFRKPAFVEGDGKSSVQELIDQKNCHEWRGVKHTSPLTRILVDDLVVENLHQQGLSLDSVVEKEREVGLRKTANLSTGGEAWDVTDQVSPENAEMFEKIAKVCDLNIIGIDVMCQNLSTPIVDQDRAGVIEVNSSPGLRMHHYPMRGKPRNVAGAILDLVYRRVGL